MKKLLASALLIFAYAFTAQAQTEEFATIYVYRNFYHTTFGKAAPKVELKDEALATLDEGRYFIARVPLGLVIVKCGKKRENRVEIDARAGEVYYIRARAHPGKLFTRFELFRATKEEFEQDKEKLRYVEAKDIKSPRVVKEESNAKAPSLMLN